MRAVWLGHSAAQIWVFLGWSVAQNGLILAWSSILRWVLGIELAIVIFVCFSMG